MKLLNISLILVASLLSGSLIAQDPCSPDSVIKIDSYEYLYRYGDIYIGGDPCIEQIEWLQSKGVSQVINLKTARENRGFKRKNFDAEQLYESIGMGYTWVAVGGGKDSEHPDKLGEIAEVLNTGEKVLIHCTTCARARYVLMAYLVREKDCPEETAKKVLLKMGYYFPLDSLFKREIRMYVEEDPNSAN